MLVGDIQKQPAERYVERWNHLDWSTPKESFRQMKEFSKNRDGNFGFPWTASREHLMTVGRIQKLPGWSRSIDPLLRDYAVRSRFLWANVFRWDNSIETRLKN